MKCVLNPAGQLFFFAETILYTNMLKPLEHVGWDSRRTCVRGTRNAVINGLVL